MSLLEESIQSLFISKGWTLSLAESCTGGGISSGLVQIPGASNYFLGSLVVYSNALKESLLNVPPSILLTQGAVSSECAVIMAQNLHSLTHSTWTGSITGIAGPTGGTPEKPVGTVYMALSYLGQAPTLHCYHFEGSRSSILLQTQESFLSLLLSAKIATL